MKRKSLYISIFISLICFLPNPAQSADPYSNLVQDISQVTTSNNNTIPVVDTSEAETTVTIQDGVTIVIGGLIKDESVGAKRKIPVIGDIPVLGYAFRNENNLVRKTEVVIFLTPKIFSGDAPY